jgi:hypothetical protein
MITNNEIALCVRAIEAEFRNAPGLILSEDDAKCILYAKLYSKLLESGSLIRPTEQRAILASTIHTEIKFLDENNKPSIRPDITILDTTGISLTESRGTLSISSKGFVLFGSAIAIEIKFCKAARGVGSKFVASVRKDCVKLTQLKQRLYPETEAPVFRGVVVVFSRDGRASQHFANLQAEYADHADVEIIYATANFNRLTPLATPA